jgi:hypothetical protein
MARSITCAKDHSDPCGMREISAFLLVLDLEILSRRIVAREVDENVRNHD